MLINSEKLEKEIKAIQLKLKDFPEGKFICAVNGANYKWYRSDGHKSVYIPKSERALAEQLAHKKYLELQLKNMQQEKHAIDSYLKLSNPNANQTELDFFTSPKYQDLLTHISSPLSMELQEWMNSPYEKNKKYQENLIYKAASGNMVRSKSERLIDMILSRRKIPFRYEFLLQLGELFLYPDFTIRHPRTGKVYYWEHFGLMDNPDYAEKSSLKIRTYISNGIIPSIQLITTYETKESPLSIEMVEEIVRYHFL